MSFDQREISTQDGRPAALYRISWGQTHWFYTSADQEIDREEVVNGVMVVVRYEPRAMSDGGMVQGSSSQNDFTVEGPSDLPIVRLFRGTPPALPIHLTVRRVHESPEDAPIYWKGTIYNIKRPRDAMCQIIGKPISASLKRTGLRLCWTKECPHFVYDEGCSARPEVFRVLATAAAVGVVSVTALLEESKPDGYFRGGILEWIANEDGTIERRMIEEDVREGSTARLTILGIVDGLKVGSSLKLFPGCNRTAAMCESRFDNLENYGGFDKMPGKSPFDTAIW